MRVERISRTMRASSVRAFADDARQRGAWWLDAYYRRKLCERPGALPGDWIQYGHSLKEMGHMDAAERVYVRAATEMPDDPEPVFQLGHLLKLRGNFDGARQAFEQACQRGHENAADIAFELGLIAGATSQVGAHLRAIAGDREGVRIFLSAPAPLFSETSAAALTGLGGSDYSYAFAMRGFATALDELEIDYLFIANPEYIADIRPRSDAAINIHLGFYPPERVRLLKGAYNVICFAWEFERLRSRGEVTGYHAFTDQATMLGTADELWVPSSEGVSVVAREVSRPVYHVPSMIPVDPHTKPRAAKSGWRRADRLIRAVKDVEWQPLAILPRIQGTMNGMARGRRGTTRSILYRNMPDHVPTIFLTVLNVHDFRKQLRPMLEGFLEFVTDQPNAYLLIKMTTPDRGKLTANEFLAMDQVSNAGLLIPPMVSNRIWITDQFLTREEMNGLYDLADFYLCTSHAEGQNLPLIEAMARGVVPVSVATTAMRDYVLPENAVVIPSSTALAEPRISYRYNLYDLQIDTVTAAGVAQSIREAYSLDEQTYCAKSESAVGVVKHRFNARPIADAIARIVNEQAKAKAQTE